MNKTAFIFPGQGAQKAGMGKDFYRKSAAAREVFDQVADILDLDIRKICFEQDERLDITEYTQAAMVTTCLAIWQEINRRGFRADVTAGLSLGEYCALTVCGAMDFVDSVRVVRQRGIFMQQEVPAGQGAMAAVLGMNTQQIEAVLALMSDVWIANYNCPGQVVISGRTEAVETACAQLKAAGAKRAVKLNVSGPFHSPILVGAGDKLAGVLEPVVLHDPEIPYITNVTAEYVTGQENIKELLKRQVYSPVRWQQSVETMINNGVNTFVEIGPGKTLSSLVRKISREVSVCTVETIDDLDKLQAAGCLGEE